MIYTNGKVYKITSDQTDQVYIGSTCSPLSQRMAQHRSNMRAHVAGTRPHVCTSSAIVQFDDATITLIEDCPCENKEQLHRRERFHIEATANCVNRVVPGRTNAEYYQANRDAIAVKVAEYYQDNREAIAARVAEYREINREAIAAKVAEKIACECGATIAAGNLARHRRAAKHMRFIAANEPPAVDLVV